MVRPTSDPKPHQLQLRCSDEYLASIDEWRAKQRPIPSRSEAIRQLTQIALGKAAKPKSK
jgi:metal-responsive CopG/Arc/MetJ family transcriptional regulator